MPKRLGLQFCNITLRACRVVSDSEIIFRYAIDGNLRGIKMLFDAGSASAYDVDASTGTSALVVNLHINVQTRRANFSSMPPIEAISTCGSFFCKQEQIVIRRLRPDSKISYR